MSTCFQCLLAKKKSFWFIIVLTGVIVVAGIFYVQKVFNVDKIPLNTGINSSSADKPLPLSTGQTLRQTIDPQSNQLAGIAFLYGTYGRINHGSMNIKLYEDSRIIEQWNYSLDSLVKDNIYLYCYLQKPIIVNKNKHYVISISENPIDTNNMVAIWTVSNAKQGFSSAILDNQVQSTAICYKMIYQTFDTSSIKWGLCLWLILIFVLFGIAKRYKVSNSNIFLMLLLITGGMYFVAIPLGMVPDEYAHFLRAFEISRGHLVSSHLGAKGTGGDYLPSNLGLYQGTIIDYPSSFQHLSDSMNQSKQVPYYFGNTALYSPVSYLPQVVGVLLASLLTSKVMLVFYAGRFTNFVICSLLLYFAYKKMPERKLLLMSVIFLPMFMQELISMSPDGFTNTLSVCLLVYVFYLCEKNETIKTRDILILMILCLLLSLCKIVYLPLCFLPLLIPSSRFSSKQTALSVKAGIIILCMVINSFWLKEASGYLVEFNPGVNSKEQIKFILFHPSQYGIVLLRTIKQNFVVWTDTMIGSQLGWLNIHIPAFIYKTYGVWIVLLILFDRGIKQLRYKQMTVLCISIFSVFLLVCTSLYVQWTPLQARVISGIQGRYFLPVLLPFLIVLSSAAAYVRQRFRWFACSDVSPFVKHESIIYYGIILLSFYTIVNVVAAYSGI